LFRRWLTFNGVGALGLVVQIGTLALLHHELEWHYLAATALAVEAAILHNFVWHQRWTWRDRREHGWRAALTRLWRFHLLNGVVSLAGNLGIMAVLTGGLGLHPVVANLAAVLACSIVNFLGSEVVVFRTATTLVAVLVSPALLGAVEPEGLAPAELRAHTVAAWKKYEEAVDQRHRALSASSNPFFVHDEYERDSQWRSNVLKGAVEMFQADAARPGGGAIDVPDGRIHHWVGAVFVPGADLDSVLTRLRDNAGKEAGSYKEVIDSRLLERNGNRLRVFLKIERDATVTTVTYNTEHQVEYTTLGRTRASNRTTATKIAELTAAGTPQEREKTPGNDSGYLWRLNAYWRYEEVPGGVLIECESVSLSRSVPMLFRPLVNPIANRLARGSLESTLISLRGVLAPQLKSAS
jgi:putative flippase GtrA